MLDRRRVQIGGEEKGKPTAILSMWQQISRKHIVLVQSIGFSLLIIMLLIMGVVAVGNVRAIKGNAATLVNEQLLMVRLIDRIQRSQATLRLLLHRQATDPNSSDLEKVLNQLDQSNQEVERSVTLTSGTPETALWLALKQSNQAFSEVARKFLQSRSTASVSSEALFEKQETVMAAVRKLTAASYQRAATAQEQIEHRSQGIVQKTFLLFGACLLLGGLCAVLTIHTTFDLYKKMQFQSAELSRASWQMLEKQETTARRFSHELHDELGQSLTAIKANLASLGVNDTREERIQDCLRLVGEAIENVRELSQLLHPVVLDDLGLDAALCWLCDRFAQRTAIEITYDSTLDQRLSDETETHLFRIAQEALTNIARHSQGKHVEARLERNGESVKLMIADDGVGMQARSTAGSDFGLLGMRARARILGGELTIRSGKNQGVSIEAIVPLKEVSHESKTTNRFSG